MVQRQGHIVKCMIGSVCALFLAVLAFAAGQPVAYSHKQHIAMGLRCLDCHSTADTSAAATIPSVSKCMLCHAKLGVNKPEVQKLAAFAKEKREIPWERIYGFERNALVKFQHGAHARAKIDCATCHGDIAQMTVATKAVNHTMGTCIDCHRQNKASDDCAACHY